MCLIRPSKPISDGAGAGFGTTTGRAAGAAGRVGAAGRGALVATALAVTPARSADATGSAGASVARGGGIMAAEDGAGSIVGVTGASRLADVVVVASGAIKRTITSTRIITLTAATVIGRP